MATVLTAIRRFECDASNVALVRAFVARTVRAWGWPADDSDDAILLASELAANAVVHARSAFEVRLRLDDGGLRIEVVDGDVRPPSPTDAPKSATCGRGLRIASAMTASWGVLPRPEGKVVWAQLPRREGPAAESQRPR